MDLEDRLPDVPFGLTDLTRLGLSRKQLRRLVEEGSVHRVARGAYAAATMPDTTANRARAIALVAPPGHVITDRTAAWIHDVDTYVYAEFDAPPPVDICALRGRGPSGRHEANGRTRDLAPADIMELEGLRVTTPLRTALDLGCGLKRREAKAALDAFARGHGITAEDMAKAAGRFRRRRGVRQLRELIGLVNPLNESERESWTELAIHDEGLPLPQSQVWIWSDGACVYRLDHAYEHARIAIEYDGFDAHERSIDQMEYDADRRAWLRENGWTVIVVRRGDFTGERLQRWLGELRRALRPSYSNVRRMERNSRILGPGHA